MFVESCHLGRAQGCLWARIKTNNGRAFLALYQRVFIYLQPNIDSDNRNDDKKLESLQNVENLCSFVFMLTFGMKKRRGRRWVGSLDGKEISRRETGWSVRGAGEVVYKTETCDSVWLFRARASQKSWYHKSRVFSTRKWSKRCRRVSWSSYLFRIRNVVLWMWNTSFVTPRPGTFLTRSICPS